MTAHRSTGNPHSALRSVRLPEDLERRLLFATITVTNQNDLVAPGDGVSLREAIMSTNSNSDLNADVTASRAGGYFAFAADTIQFNIPGTGVRTIQPTTSLPTITNPLNIDGYSQPLATANTLAVGDNANLLIELDGVNFSMDGISLQPGSGGSSVRGLTINRMVRAVTINGAGSTTVAGNFLGTDTTGTIDRGNLEFGVLVNNSPNNVIGGTAPADRNVISGNDASGVLIVDLNSVVNVVQGNYIGTTATGADSLSNTFYGVLIEGGASGNTVGGDMAGAGNVISGNGTSGILIDGDLTATKDTTIQGNIIGLTASGNQQLGNDGDGISINAASGTQIGGTAPPARNVISGNADSGIGTSKGGVKGIQGNFIGTDITGTFGLGNGAYGIALSQGGADIGGITPGSENLISGNKTGGITQTLAVANIQGNRIGTDIGGTLPIPNLGDGIWASSDSTIGGSVAAAANIIAFNTGAGVRVPDNEARISIRRNSIFSNGELGIDLEDFAGVTNNDPGDPDNGGNNLQNFPVISSAISAGGVTTIEGSLNSTANSLFILDFYSDVEPDPSQSGEGRTYLGSKTVLTDNSGNALFTASLPVTVTGGKVITATATDLNLAPAGSTSEFSQAVDVVGPPPPVFSINDVTKAEGNGPGATAFTFTVTRTGDLSNPSTVYYATADGVGTQPGDYAAVPTTLLSFAANEASKTVTVNVVVDTVVESDETFFVNLSTPTGATIGDSQGLGTIVNDDALPATAIIAPDPAAPGKMALIITGTDNGEYIDVDPGSSSSKLKVEVDDVLIGEFNTSAFDRIYVYAKGGDDRVAITTSTTKTAIVFGGDGQDQIKGGSGKDILLGEAQNDIIRGRKGRDIIIGGLGADGISGDEDDDLIIAAATTFDADLPALFAFQKEWVSSNTYSKRRDNVRNGTGSNVGGRKLNDVSILEDNALDLLSGNSGTDLFFYHKTGSTTQVADKINDKSSSETAVDAS